VNRSDDEAIAAIRSSEAPVVLFGAGDLGRLALHALRQRGIRVTCFSDGRVSKQGTEWRGVPIKAPEELAGLPSSTHVFVCGNYFDTMPRMLAELGLTNLHDCADLFAATDFTGADVDMDPVFIERKVSLHQRESAKARDRQAGVLALKYLDVVVTEACSMKCQDCSNLMQYYSKPRHSDLDLLARAVDRIMDSIDRIYEFRVLGGEPFVNPKVHKVITKLTGYADVTKVIIYTNATIVPSGENLECLRHPKVVVDITNYGEHSRRYAELLTALADNGIAHLTKTPVWTDSGRINFVARADDVLDDMFANCCVNDILTLLNGRLYRCPFSANGTNLGAIPHEDADVVDLTGDLAGAELRERISRLYGRSSHLRACEYCNGRDYRTPRIEPAIQTRRPLPLVSVT
jgi:organic radical activating enzyme